jgi:hypothetical protein
MAAKTRRPLRRERDRLDVAALYPHGLTQHEMIQRLHVPAPATARGRALNRFCHPASALCTAVSSSSALRGFGR